jgi:hypothetical protein
MGLYVFAALKLAVLIKSSSIPVIMVRGLIVGDTPPFIGKAFN